MLFWCFQMTRMWNGIGISTESLSSLTSALGHQQTNYCRKSMSALPLQADQFSEKADITVAMSGLPS